MAEGNVKCKCVRPCVNCGTSKFICDSPSHRRALIRPFPCCETCYHYSCVCPARDAVKTCNQSPCVCGSCDVKIHICPQPISLNEWTAILREIQKQNTELCIYLSETRKELHDAKREITYLQGQLYERSKP
jgi:hypothetical protein